MTILQSKPKNKISAKVKISTKAEQGESGEGNKDVAKGRGAPPVVWEFQRNINTSIREPRCFLKNSCVGSLHSSSQVCRQSL